MSMRTLLCLLPAFFLPALAWALQTLPVEDGVSVAVQLSKEETTRIAVKNGRLAKVWGAEANLHVLADTDSGELFVTPLAAAPVSFSFFVRDSDNRTYTLQATQADLPSTTILLVPPNLPEQPAAFVPAALRDEPYVQRIKRLMKGMARQQAVVDGFQRTHLKEPVPLWQEAEIMLTARFRGRYLTGEMYQLILAPAIWCWQKANF